MKLSPWAKERILKKASAEGEKRKDIRGIK